MKERKRRIKILRIDLVENWKERKIEGERKSRRESKFEVKKKKKIREEEREKY